MRRSLPSARSQKPRTRNASSRAPAWRRPKRRPVASRAIVPETSIRSREFAKPARCARKTIARAGRRTNKRSCLPGTKAIKPTTVCKLTSGRRVSATARSARSWCGWMAADSFPDPARSCVPMTANGSRAAADPTWARRGSDGTAFVPVLDGVLIPQHPADSVVMPNGAQVFWCGRSSARSGGAGARRFPLRADSSSIPGPPGAPRSSRVLHR
jgi:hypothetical protein